MARSARGSLKFLFFWLAPTMFLLVAARLLVIFIPFRLIIRRSGAAFQERPVTILPTIRLQQHRARHARRVLAQARQHLPLSINCFPQALLAIFLLRFRNVPYSLFFGVRRNDGDFQAHAWVVCGSVTVCGDCDPSEYSIISTYTYQVPS